MAKIHRVRWGFRTDAEHRRFVAERLKALKTGLKAEIHDTTNERSLRLATWNIMHFGNSGTYDRTVESMLYIAEIIDHFDLVAVQEVNRNLSKLNELVDKYLGDEWEYVVSDTSGKPTGEGRTDDGNNERLAFLFRKRKVRFCKEVGEIVLPRGSGIEVKNDQGTVEEVQFARTPFAVTFRSGWLEFKLVTVHILYGSSSNSSAKMARRKDEIGAIARFLADRQEWERDQGVAIAREEGWVKPEEGGWNANYMLLGDFNIVSPEHETMQRLSENGFESATGHTTDLGDKHHYDQIAVKAANPHFKVLRSGAFDMLAHVYRDQDADHYLAVARRAQERGETRDTILKLIDDERDDAGAKAYFKRFYRRMQLSDHKLLWCEVETDYAGEYLDAVIADSMGPAA
ncbi:endonuclease/exonuclease/phosphatase family protein [Qipengyuania nanhaisediminis]|uniref:endonuclease/exonuclease/phosphatase family protein n=1 Tax=Qipengyuania nanhaisediminis TaxID=604088 RepID=UPI0038B3E17E